MYPSRQRILGAASYAESEERRVRILKENGFNAVRSAHNPISTAMLDACDRYGIYVMDEAWDMWYKPKMKHDYALDFDRCWQEDLESMVRRDYSPSQRGHVFHRKRGVGACRSSRD